MKTKISLLTLSFLCLLPLAAQVAMHGIAVKNPDKTCIGAVMEHKSINSDAHRFVNITAPEPIRIYFSLPVKDQTIITTYENMMKTIRESVVASGKIKAHHGFSFQLLEIKSYDRLSWFFGQTMSPQTFFGIPSNTKLLKTTVVVNMTQSFFSIGMDFPNDGKLYDKDPEITKRADELIYVATLFFGRKITAVVESIATFAELKAAIEESLNSQEKPISKKSRAILANADIRFMMLGATELPQHDPENPFAPAMAYFNKPVTIDDFGVPLGFHANYIKDNSAFDNEY